MRYICLRCYADTHYAPIGFMPRIEEPNYVWGICRACREEE